VVWFHVEGACGFKNKRVSFISFNLAILFDGGVLIVCWGFSGFPKFSVGVTKRKKYRAFIIFNGIATYTEADQKNKLLLFVFGLNILS